jgi:L-2-hydroxyglutarate oxidase LhgO
VVNSAGLWAHKIASLIHNNHSWQPPSHYFAKGTYFRLEGKPPFRHLIYPVPEPGGLGVHATIDWSGRSVKFGPDVEWLDPDVHPNDISLDPDPRRGEKFYDQVRKYWPLLPDKKLVPDYVGIRPKLNHPSTQASGLSFMDFHIVGRESHGVPGLIHLFGIESPGLTSSMAIADHIRDVLTD